MTEKSAVQYTEQYTEPGTELVSLLRQVLGVPAEPIYLHEPLFQGNEIDYVSDCIQSGWVSSVGAYVDRFESMLSERCGAYAIATVNGTAALHLSVVLSGVSEGDEVLMPSLSFVATANAVAYVNAVPHFCDSHPQGIGLDIEKLDAYLREKTRIHRKQCINRDTGRVIKALIVMHTFGHMQNIPALLALASRYYLVLIEDAAEALGSSYWDETTSTYQPAGSYGRVSALSFNGNKIITAGGGGAILTKDKALASRAKHLTTTAKVSTCEHYYHDEVAYNYRLPNLNAALAVAQLEQLEVYVAAKRALANKYKHVFEQANNFAYLTPEKACRSNYWLNTVLIKGAGVKERQSKNTQSTAPGSTGLENGDTENGERVMRRVLSVAKEANFECRPVWCPLHLLPMYEACPTMDMTASETLQHQLLNLPSSVFLNAGERG
jgi:perosamine synthetase